MLIHFFIYSDKLTLLIDFMQILVEAMKKNKVHFTAVKAMS